MKKYLLLLIALIGITSFVNAQGSKFVNYERDNGWNIGFNMGATWQPREGILIGNHIDSLLLSGDKTKPYAGFGGGMTLGKSIYEREGSFFAVDLRGRYLGSYNAGWSGVPEYSYELTGDTSGASFGFRNYKMNLHEFSLEAVLTLNRLRERTGIILYGFGGIGATLNNVKSDYRDFTGSHYDYSVSQFGINSVDTSQNAQTIAAQVKEISDLDFETTITNTRFSLVPSWGVGFGYQIGPSFSMGVEYKLAYDILGDEFDGGASNMLKDNIMDKYHYTGVFFRWNILSGGQTFTVDPDPDPWTPNPTNPTTVVPNPPVANNKPLVNIYNPSSNNKEVHNPTYTIKAKIYHVETQSGVKFSQNGLNITNFSFNPTTDEFTAQVYLYPGSNVFEITGTNPYGSDQDSRIIILQQEVQQVPPPIVTYTNPVQDGMTVSQPQFTVVSNVLNVAGKGDITFTFNNQTSTNFTYNTSSKVLTSVVTLVPGKNVITVKGVNSVGSDIETITINYHKPVTVQPPVVKITNPSTNPYTTNSPVEVIQGTVHYVDGASDINVSVNGNQVTNFTYSTLTKKISFSANLIVGANVVQITGTNQFGTDAATTTIIYKPSEVMPLPIVEFIVPATSPYWSPANNVTLKATVLNVTSKQYISVNVNGVNTTAFSYNSISKEVSFNVNLINGNNVFKVTGTNTVGSDFDEQIIIHKLVQEQPPVVNITNPGSNPHNTMVGTQIINAEIQHVETVTGVTAKFNGQTITNFTFDPISDKFVYNATLLLGANILEVTGTNSVGTASKSQTIIYTQPVNECDKPVIALTQPAAQSKTVPGLNTPSGNNLTINTSNSKGSIIGKITGSSTVDFKINGVSSPGYNFNSNTGDFETFLHLEEGANNYQLVATNNCGTTITSVTYIYTPEEQPCDNPVIQWVYPTASPFNYTGPAAISLSASVLGVDNPTKISVKINGQDRKFVFDPISGNLAFGGNLNEGANNVVITARNECGTVTGNMTVNYTTPVAPPTVTITVPTADPYLTFNGNMSAKASITGVDTKSQIQVYLNGLSVSNFSYSTSAKQITVPLNLTVGTYTLKVTATNNAGSASDETEIGIQEQCQDPMITLTQPTSASGSSITFNTSNSKGSIIANIEHATNIVFKINGQANTGYNYDPATGNFESFLHLTEGTTVYTLSATNNCNVTTQKTVSIVYTPAPVECNEPVITYTNPSTNPYTSTKAKGVVISASVSEVSNSNQLVCTVNGSTVPHTFNSATKSVSFTTGLMEGNNPISITATNNCGSTTEQITVVYDKPTPRPEVQITTPAQDPYTTSSSNVLVTANVLNVSGQSAISMTVDGQAFTNFSYSYTTKVLTSNLTLDNGSHTIVVKGTNSSGSAQDQTVIEVAIPVTPPEVNIGNVTGSTSSNPYVAPSCVQFNVTGVVTNASGSEVTYVVDGISASGVRTNALSPSMLQFSVPVTFVQPGQVVTLTVTATTEDGTDSQTVYLTCQGTTTPEDPNTNDGGNGGTNTGNIHNTLPNGNGNGGEEEGNNGNGNSNGNNGHGNNVDGVDSSNPGQGGGGPNGQTDASGNTDDEGGNGNSGNNGGGNGNGSQMGTVTPPNTQQQLEQEKTTQYNDYIKKADSYYSQKNYDEAYNYYQKASSAKPNESYPKNQMNSIVGIKQQQETDAAYDAKIKQADIYFKAGKYTTAKTYYTQALSVKPNSSYAKGKISEIDAKLKEAEKPVNVVKPTNPVVKPTNTGGGAKTPTTTTSGGSKTNTTPTTGDSKTTTPTTTTTKPKTTTPDLTKPKVSSPTPKAVVTP
ncbi:MAG: hypothetical protein H6600_04580 [Flavobacteriales bacterium]|nr:hypothetical protein [Flavobacteriales bacterium]MCB9197711.1 hypothetical protein [Flavobacteriales bacterium]